MVSLYSAQIFITKLYQQGNESNTGMHTQRTDDRNDMNNDWVIVISVIFS